MKKITLSKTITLNKTLVEKLLGRKGFLKAKEFHLFWDKLIIEFSLKREA